MKKGSWPNLHLLKREKLLIGAQINCNCLPRGGALNRLGQSNEEVKIKFKF